MCNQLQRVTFFCGHQVNYWWGKARFCLFAGDNANRFHTVYTIFEQNSDSCPRCVISKKIRNKKLKIPHAEFQRRVNEAYEKTNDAWQEQRAKHFARQAKDAQSRLTTAQIADLEDQIQLRIASFLGGKRRLSGAAKAVLFRTITLLPGVFNRQLMVRFFASRYFREGKTNKTLGEWERKKLFSTANKAGLYRTLTEGLNLTEPLPLPVRQEAEPDRTEESEQGEQSEETELTEPAETSEQAELVKPTKSIEPAKPTGPTKVTQWIELTEPAKPTKPIEQVDAGLAKMSLS